MATLSKYNQWDRLTSLENNNKNIMDLLKNTNEKVEKIYEYIFEGKMEDKYSTKLESNQIKKDVDKHQTIIDRITWAVILGVLAFVGTSALTVYKTFQWKIG